MNGMTEEEYELQVLGVGQDDDINSEDEHQEIEEALYQAVHYSESIAANDSIHEVTDKQDENSWSHHSKHELPSLSSAPSHTATPQKLDSKEDVIATDRIDLPCHQDSHILVDDDEISKFLSICRKASDFKSKSLDFNSVKNIKDFADESSDYESDTDLTRPNLRNGVLGENSPSCHSNKNNVLKDSNRTSKTKTSIDRLLKGSESDDDCCIIIESTSEDENLQVHFASNEDTSPSKKKAKKPARYFEEPTSKKGKCYNCNEVGHYMSDCPEAKKPIACIMCGVQGHYYKACPNQLCYNCDSPGHESKSCTKKRIHWTTVCKRCYMSGHGMATCADRWRQFHLTTKSRPRLLFGAEEIMKQMYCYNCGKEGHLGYECTADRMDRYVKVNYPFVCNYSFKSFVCTAYKTTDNEPEVSSTWPTEHEPSDITNSKDKGKKKKKKKLKLLQTVEKQQEEKDLEIVISKSGKKRKVNCKKAKQVEEKKRGAEQMEETETRVDENKKTKKKSKKKKKIETETNAKEENAVGSKTPSSDKDKTVVDDNVIYLETVSTRKRVAEEDIIVLSSEGEGGNGKTDIIVISDGSACEETPKKRKKRKTEKAAVCEDQDVIILPDLEERNDESSILHIEDNEEEDNANSRTPLGLVWGFPDAVVRNNQNQIPKKIKKIFSENMRKHNQTPTNKEEKRRRYRLKQRNRMSDAVSTADISIASKKFQKRRKREKKKKMQITEPKLSKNKQGKKKKGVMQVPLNIPKVKVEFSNHQPSTSSRFVISADRRRHKWLKKKDVNLSQTT
ncbi:zinc finger CCHC domain-containing protein 7-like isoform X1 [Anneissia japonica]|uniref:zinc finger CCHC domain-containing protein 7-like isoform X1 n=1 Tax=Anneissia japonica TaxID=1529436 RepID=UPI0014259C48|nr:zinc finger CCHC domain-containing protein 7-like isoform X1 [Anneissia japonica]